MIHRKVILYISMSLDGYLAGENDDLSWLGCVHQEGEDYGYASFNESVDTYIVGRKTYEVVLKLTGGSFPQAEKHHCYVLSSKKMEENNGVHFYNGSLRELISSLKSTPGKNIYCDGGAKVVQSLMKENLIDEFIISVIPILLGKGQRLFIGDTPTTNLELIGSESFKSGLVQLKYKMKQP